MDPLKELDEALMDRTTAQQSLKGKTIHLQKVKINSSNFEKGSHQAAQAIKKLQLATAPVGTTSVSPALTVHVSTPATKTSIKRPNLKPHYTPSPHISPAQPSP